MIQEREFKDSSLNINYAVTIRHFGRYEDTNATWARLTQFAFHAGVAGPNVQPFGISYDDPTNTPEEKIRYDACLSISKDQYEDLRKRLDTDTNLDPALVEGIRVEQIPIGKTKAAVHKGPYKHIRDAYTDVLKTSAFKGLTGTPGQQPKPPFIEVYRNNPLLTLSANLITEIHVRQ